MEKVDLTKLEAAATHYVDSMTGVGAATFYDYYKELSALLIQELRNRDLIKGK